MVTLGEVLNDEFKRIGLEMGLEQGLEQGRRQERVEIIRRMLTRDITLDIIEAATGATREQILKVAAEESIGS